MVELQTTTFLIPASDFKFLLYFHPMLRRSTAVTFWNSLRKALCWLTVSIKWMHFRSNRNQVFFQVFFFSPCNSLYKYTCTTSPSKKIVRINFKNIIQHHMKLFPNMSKFNSGYNCSKYFSPFLLPPFSQSSLFSVILCHC